MAPVMDKVMETPVREREVPKTREEFARERKVMGDEMTAYPLAEGAYAGLEKRFWHQQRGYTLRGMSLGAAAGHVRENCMDMALVSEGESAGENVFMYSFKMGSVHELLTVVLKQEEGLLHVMFKLYSEKRDVLARDLERIAGMMKYLMTEKGDAREVEHVEIKKVINIIDSVVQRSEIGAGGDEGEVTEKKTRIRDSVVQRTDV
jgi:hypothetical protein